MWQILLTTLATWQGWCWHTGRNNLFLHNFLGRNSKHIFFLFFNNKLWCDFDFQAAIGLLQRRKKQRKKQNLRFDTFCLLHFSWTGVDIEVDIPTVKVKYLHYNRSCVIQYVTRLRTSVRTSSASKPIVSSTSLAARLKKKQKSSALSAKVRVSN